MSANKISRVAKMDFREIRHRLLETLKITRERISLSRNSYQRDVSDWRTCWDSSMISIPAVRTALTDNRGSAEVVLSDYLFSWRRPAFYSSIVDQEEIAQIYGDLFPGRVEQISSDAKRLHKHLITVFAYPEVDCGPHIPWRKDIVHGIESGLAHRSRIRYLNFANVGDSKIVWEPNRHQHLVILATAYRLTGDNRFAEECFAQWDDWQRNNPYLRGINWASSLELAFRTWSWIWMMYLLAGSRVATGKRLGEMTHALTLHADFISAYLSTYFSPNTHLLGEGFALFVIGLLFPELRSSNSYRETGRQIVMEEIMKQVRADGSHAEQSTCYHRYATDFFLCASILADRNKCPFPDAFRSRLERMVEFMSHTAWPDGTHPMIGDADGGRLLPFGICDPNDHRSTLSTAAVYFGRQDFRDCAGRLYEETVWLLGPKAATRFEQLIPKPPREKSKAFSESGVFVMRTSWDTDANMLLFDAGPQGMGNCGHGHADALSIICSAQGIKWLIDPGTFVYTASHEWRDYFRSTHAHSTLVIDGRGQAEPVDTFKWHSECPAFLERYTTLPNLDYVSGSHEGYKRLVEPVLHRRQVVFIKPDHWFLLDDVVGSGSHSLEFLFHFAPDIELRIENNACWATTRGKHFLLLSDLRGVFETVTGTEHPIQGWYSENYGHRRPVHVLTSKTRCTLPARFAWVLWSGSPAGVRLHAIADDLSGWAVETSTQVEYFIFNDFNDSLTSHSNTKLITDADFAFLRQDREGQTARITLLGGSQLVHNGTALFRSEGMVKETEIERRSRQLQVRMQPVKPFYMAMKKVESVSLNGKPVRFARTESSIEVREGT